MVTISDVKKGVPRTDDSTMVDHYVAVVVNAQDYYPFGMQMEGRGYAAKNYRYGFNGKEKDDEINGSGVDYNYGFRIYDARSGKFLSVDPLTKKFAYYSPYQFAGNGPIHSVDIDGLEPFSANVLRAVSSVSGKLIGGVFKFQL